MKGGVMNFRSASLLIGFGVIGIGIGYLLGEYWKQEFGYGKESVILVIPTNKTVLLGKAVPPCPDNPKKTVTVEPEGVIISDCDGDSLIDFVRYGENDFSVVATAAEATHYNVAELNKIRGSRPPRTCPDGTKDKGDIRKDEAGVWRLWYCGKPEPYGETYLSRDQGEGLRYQREYEKPVTKK